MKGDEGLYRAVEQLARAPHRWGRSDSFGLYGHEHPAPKDEVCAALDAMERGLAALGPPDEDEPVPVDYADEDLRVWADFVQAFSSRRAMTAEAVRSYLASRDQEAVPFPARRQKVSWRGLMRAWVRAELEQLGAAALAEVPVFFLEDPLALRDELFARFRRFAPMLPDLAQANWLAHVAECDAERAVPIARQLYHHPGAGPRMKACIDEIFEEDFAGRIKARPGPERHD